MWMTVLWLGQSVGPLAMGPIIIPGAQTGVLVPIPNGGTPCSGGETWSCLNMISQTLLTPNGRPYPFRGVGGGLGWGRNRRRGGGLNCCWYVCKMKKYFQVKNLKNIFLWSFIKKHKPI